MNDPSQPDRPDAGAISDPDASDRPPSAGPVFHVEWAAGTADADTIGPCLDALLHRLAQAFVPRTGDVRVRVVADDAMAEAHERYKDTPGTTDVLTFDLAGDPAAPLDADLLICADEASRQAAARGIPVEHELLLYVAHGVLHCSGYDDDTDEAARAMHAREDELLTAAGVGPVYSASPTRSEAAP